MRKITLQELADITGATIVYYRHKGQVFIDGYFIGFLEDLIFFHDPGIMNHNIKFITVFKPKIPDKTKFENKNLKYLEMLSENNIIVLGDLRYEAARNSTDKRTIYHLFQLYNNYEIYKLARLSTTHIFNRFGRISKIVINEFHELGISFADESEFSPPSDDKIHSKIERIIADKKLYN